MHALSEARYRHSVAQYQMPGTDVAERHSRRLVLTQDAAASSVRRRRTGPVQGSGFRVQGPGFR
eukprot:540358-Rhodomonas_salina.2